MNVRTQPARALATPRTPARILARWAAMALASLALLCLPAAAEAQVTIGQSATGEAAATVPPGNNKVLLDAFTLITSSGAPVVTNLTVQLLPVLSAQLVEQVTIESAATCAMPSPLGVVNNPASETVSVALAGLPVTTTSATYFVCVKPRAPTAMPPVGGSALAVTGRVSAGVAAGFTVSSTDAVGPAITIDNLSPGAVTAASGVAGDHQVGLTWTNPADADFKEVVILRSLNPISDAPTEGVAYQPFTLNGLTGLYEPTTIGASRVDYVGSASTVAIGSSVIDPATWLTNGTPYYFKIFARDFSGNYSAVGVQVGPITPVLFSVTTIGFGVESAAASLAPGGPITNLDAFTLVTTGANDTVTAATISLSPSNAFANIGLVQITSNDGLTVYASRIDPASSTISFTGLAIPVTTTSVQFRIRIQPKTHAAMPAVPGASYAVTGLLTAFTSTKQRSGSDTGSSTVTIDNRSPDNATWGTVSPGNTNVVLNWTNPTVPSPDFLRVAIVQAGAPVTAMPVEGDLGATPALTGTGTVAFVGATTTATIGGLTNGTPYYFKIFAQDSSGNWSTGTGIGPLIPGTGASSVGSTVPDTLLPVVQVVNPIAGAKLATTFKVQVRAWSPVADITGVDVRVNLGAPTPLTKSLKYGGGATSGVWEGSLTLPAGSYTLDAQASSSVGTVTSNSLLVNVAATRGDGSLLVRDNAAQLCTDCHNLPTHSSQTTGSTYGSWSTSCRDCHTPHGTHNVFLVGESITPPPRGAGVTTPKAVAFSNTSGTPGNAAARTTASYTNTDNTGPCQVCHTLTLYYRADGSSPGGADHQTGNRCTDCHQHSTGMAVNCTGCHGTPGRTGAVAGTDPRLPAAPPRDTTGATVTTSPGVGAHLAHLNQNTLRANPLACSDCHPANNSHQGTTDFGWSALANGSLASVPLTPAYNGATCSSTWCHTAGGTYGGTILAPAWVGGPSQVASCVTCHGAPPPAPHPANPNCATCHPGYATTGLNAAARITHIDGTLQVPPPGACTSCHGTAGRTPVAGLVGTDPNIAVAPPLDTTGSTVVDAHMAHINKQSAPVQCLDCHGILPAAGDPSHPNAVLDVSMAASALANQNGGFAVYAAGTCSSVYCHGATLPDDAKGTNQSPTWASAVDCGTCHGAPPGDAIHRSAGGVTTCAKCHAETVNTSGGIIINAGTHVNGIVETNIMDMGCAGCHGAPTRAPASPGIVAPSTWYESAPPTSVTGTSTGVGVGVHQAHVNGVRSLNVQCQACHLDSAAFENDSPNLAEFWTHADGVVDIKFNTLATQGGAVINYVLGSGGTCAASYCHGNFPGGVGAGNVTPAWTTAGTLGCTACHGNPPGLPHPANDACAGCHGAGYTKTSATTGTVTQTQHVDGATTGQSFGCTSCHGVINTGSPGAVPGDTIAAPGVAGGLAVTTAVAPSVAVPQYGAHSSHLTQNSFTGAAIACGECHQLPAVDNTSHGTGGGTGGAAATMSWSALATGNVAARITPVTEISAKGGAGTGSASAAAAAAAPGGGTTADAWSTPAVPSYNRLTGCTATYCHGEFRNGQVGKTIAWTQDIVLNCNSCHGTAGANPATPPTGTHPVSTNCGACHAGYTGTTVNVTSHLNGRLEVTGGSSCDSCHGLATRTSMVAGTFGPAQSLNNLLGMPPRDSAGETVGVRVGGHPSHSVPASAATQVFKPIQCSECHGNAVNTYGLGHSNSVADVTFANATTANLGTGYTPGIAQGTGTTPDTCTTYCHGASLTAQQRGSITTWTWTTTTNATCGSCHGSAPNDPVHTTVSKSALATACNACHATVVNTSGGIIFNGTGTSATTLHINGARQTSATCRSCHGGAVNAAPPVATNGTTATTTPKVGAHQKHLTGTTLRTGALDCNNCHAVPTAMNHATGVVNVAWNTLATASAVTPAPAAGAVAAGWETAPTCTNYCHGGKWAANAQYRGATTTVSWTGTAADAACNDCHQAPPASGGHASVTTATNCNTCHGGYTCTSGNLAACTVNRTVHINGLLDAPNMTCSTCHGAAGRTAIAGTFGPAQSANNLIGMPPVDTGAASSGVKVGGHVSHSTPTPATQVITAVLCSECHGNAVNTYASTHSNSVSDVTFANATRANLGTGYTPGIAQGTGTTPDTCTTYCHGASLTAQQRGSITTWTWTSTTNANCGSCHGSAPNDPVHTSVSKSALATACNACHATVVNTSGGIIFNGTGTSATTLHINGARQTSATCRSCHGGVVNAAPPVATNGTTATTTPKVGAHQKHVTATNLRTGALTCTDCHAVPTAMNHASGAADVSWNTLATASAVTPAPATGAIASPWETAPTCTNYCHGGKWAANPTYRGATTSVSWTGTPADAQCNDCHLAPPNNGNHGTVLGSTTKNCGDCHAGYACTTGNLAACTVNRTVHLNGTFENPSLTCTSCHGANGVSAAPPIATTGATSGVKVGAHQKHLTGTTLRTGALACDNCHTVPGATNHSNSAVNVTWNTLAVASAVTPTPAAGVVAPAWETAPTCTNYCHGGKWAANAQYRGATTTVSWTGTVADAACNDCHQAPPASSGHASVTTATNCNTCHGGYTCTSGNLAACTVNRTVHINGFLDAPNMTCSTCHGAAGRTAIAGTFGPAQSTNNLIGMPPVDTGSASSGVRVGGHVSHSTPTPATQVITSVLCSECHGTAVNSYAMGHSNSVSDVTFANATRANLGTGYTPGIAQGTGTTPDTCTTYCHGASLTAQQRGSITTWTWTSTTNANCGSCHGSAPNDPVHTSVSKSALATACNPCHATTVNTSGNIIFNGTGTSATTLHVNGIRQATTTCRSCHGNATNFAPPTATNGTTATTTPKVGAHQKHLTGTTLRTGALACDNCHAVPTAQNHATGAVNVAWNTLASVGFTPTPAAGAVVVAWETAPTCTNYCHGGKWAANAQYRGATTTVSWTGTVADAACNDCHLAPPTSGGHASVTTATNCNTCHSGYTCTSGNLAACTVNRTIHLNGTADLPVMACSSCHGTAGRTAIAGTFGPAQSTNNLIGMPPIDTAAASSGVKVGGHVSHSTPTPATQVITSVLCSECHGNAVNTYASSHSNSVSDVTFANATRANLGTGYTPGIAQGTGTTPDTCTTYCHGASLTAQQRGSITTWTWTSTTNANCGSCHGSAPNDPVHTSVSKSALATACNPCHATTVNTSGNIIFNGTGTSATTLHVNGIRQATTTCRSCHGNATNFAPPTATNGTTATTTPKVGAHQKHLTGTTLRTGALDCNNCHTVPTAQNHATGAVNVAWNTLASVGFTPTPAAGAVAVAWETAPTCTNYCHGGKWAADSTKRGATTSVSWTGTVADAACNDCHQAPPTSSGHSSMTTSTSCSTCHAGYACTSGNLAACTVNRTIHLNGIFEPPSTTCVDCHTGTQGTRRPIVSEFAGAWSHKRSAVPAGTVTKFDCVVCHMEGNLTTGDVDPAYHLSAAGGPINLRDPDTGLHIKTVTWGGTNAGAYTSSATDATFVQFSRNLSSNVLEAPVTAIMINQCLKCHDANGAQVGYVRGPTAGSSAKPFNTTIAGATYTGAGVTAGGVLGGVIDVAASFNTANSSYHPISGKQNNSYVSALRMNAPWNVLTKTGGNTTSWGYLISCWDCHAPLNATGVQTATITAHGGTRTTRRDYWITNATNLCTACHQVVPATGATTNSHGAGSAFSGGGNSGPGGIARTACWRCHGSTASAKPSRPYSSQDVHGFNALSPALGTDTLWPVGATNTYRPFGFMRSAGASGTWLTTSWKPLSGPSVTTGSATCGGTATMGGASCSSRNHGAYTPGGVY